MAIPSIDCTAMARKPRRDKYVSLYVDRHGKERCRFRKGAFICPLPHPSDPEHIRRLGGGSCGGPGRVDHAELDAPAVRAEAAVRPRATSAVGARDGEAAP